MCSELTWHLQIYFKENSEEGYLKTSHRREISEAEQSNNFYN